MKLTATSVKSLKPGDYKDEKGLILRVRPSGVRSWAVRYFVKGRDVRYTIGLVKIKDWDKGLTLKQARDEAALVLARVARGEDPQAEKLAAAKALPPLPDVTVAGLCQYMLAHLKMRPNTWKPWTHDVEKRIIPELGQMPAKDLTRRHVREWADRLLAKSGGTMANRAFVALRRSYSFGIERDLIEATPFVGLKQPADYVPRDRVLSSAELWALQKALADYENVWASDAVSLLLWTGVRKDMALGARRSEFEELHSLEPRWVIPGERTKNAKTHVVPLPKTAAKLVRRLLSDGREFLFPRPGKWGKSGREFAYWHAREMDPIRDMVAAKLKKDVPQWSLHDLRTAMATHMREDLRIPDDVIALLLGHTPDVGPRVTSIYQRADLLRERRDALEAWVGWLEKLPDPKRKLLAFKESKRG